MSNKRRNKTRQKVQKEEKKEDIQSVEFETKEAEVEEESQIHQEEIPDESDDQNVDFSTPCLNADTFLGGVFKHLLGGNNIMNQSAQQQANPFAQMSNPTIPVQAVQQQVPVQTQPVQTQIPPVQQVPAQAPVQQNPVQQQVPVQTQPQMQVIQQNPVQNAQNMSALLSAYSALPNAAANQVPDNVKNMGYGEVIAKIQNLSPEKQQIAFMLLQEANTGKKLITDDQAEKAVELLDVDNDKDDDSWTAKDYLMTGAAVVATGAAAVLAYKHFKEDDVSDVIETSGEALNTLSKYVSFS